jgi:uncharacterized NAD(P)/FAD-binding protein YdhS
METRLNVAERAATVAIVGCGFSGTMVAVHLARKAPRSARLLIFERSRLARGVAYGTSRPEHLLNVPARLMSAFPDEPDHFLNWLRQREPAVQPGAFVSRLVYGDYLAELLRNASHLPGVKLESIQAEVVDVIEEASGCLSLVTRHGNRFLADAVVIAVGNPAPEDPIAVPDWMRANGSYVANPWSDDPFIGLNADDPIVLIGSGLTAIDLVVEAQSRKTVGPITAVSRHGLLPQPHTPAAATPTPKVRTGPSPSVRKMIRSIRLAVAQTERAGGDWRSVIDALRPELQNIWISLDDREKGRFLRHAAVFWDVHRHRVAPQIHEIVQSARQNGRFSLIAGRIRAMFDDGRGGVKLVVCRRGETTCETLGARRLINCTGPSRRSHPGCPSLLSALYDRGLARPDSLDMGCLAGEQGCLIGSKPLNRQRIFALGPLLKGQLWETTAVRELRQQAADLACHVASLIAHQSLPLPSTRAKAHQMTHSWPLARSTSAAIDVPDRSLIS